MAEGFIVNSIYTEIGITKKSETEISFESQISGFTTDGIQRAVEYTKVIGGLVVATTKVNPSIKVSFNYTLQGHEFNELLDNTNITAGSGFVDNYSNFDLFKVILTFSDGAEIYSKAYYDCYITLLEEKSDEEINTGAITFTCPVNLACGSDNPVIFYYSDTTEHANAIIAADAIRGY